MRPAAARHRRRAGAALCAVAAIAAASAHAEDVPRIPLRAGLTIVTAVHGSDGDYESIKRLESADDRLLRFRYSSESLHEEGIDTEPDEYHQFRPSTVPGMVIQMLTVPRTVLRADLKAADHYAQVFAPPPGVAATVPGTTAVGTSAAVLTALKTRGSADLTVYLTAFDSEPLTSADSVAGALMETRLRGTLRRVEKTAVPVPVIVNGRPVRLPAIHAKGTLGVDECEFYFLDDPDNPLALRFTIVKDSLTVISINYPGATEMTASSAGAAGPDGGQGIEQSLAATGHADVYGIYFAFNSDLIRPESEAVLKEIAALLLKHPDWRLDVDGHTDAIGGAAPNLALSTRRAAAVKKALVDRYHVAPGRLATAGYGLSRPKAPNDTLEGRALNRRVELVRQ